MQQHSEATATATAMMAIILSADIAMGHKTIFYVYNRFISHVDS
jgi:hypothetical protein